MGVYVYMLRCADNSFYVGSATGGDLSPRIDQHNAGSYRGYTFTRRPVVLVWSEYFDRITDGIAAFASDPDLGSWLVLPEALSKRILARLTSPAGRDREPAIPSSCSRCSGRKTKAAFGRPIAIDTPHSALEMPIFPANDSLGIGFKWAIIRGRRGLI